MNTEISEELQAKLEQAQSVAEIAELLRAEGYDVTEEQLLELAKAEEGELNEDALDEVAGGRIGLNDAIVRLVVKAVVYVVNKLRR